MKNMRIAVVTCLTGLTVAGLALAQEGAPARPNGAGGAGGMWNSLSLSENEQFRVGMVLEQILADPDLVQKVGLSDEQTKTLHEAVSESKKEQIRIKADMDIAAVEQADKMAQTNIDEKEIMNIVEKVGNLRTQLAKSMIKELLVVKKTLTPEQVKKVKEVTREMHRQKMMEEKEKKKEEGKDHRKEGGKDDKNGDQKDKDQPIPPPEDVKP